MSFPAKQIRLTAVSALFLFVWSFLFFTALDKTDWWIENIPVFMFVIAVFFARKKIKFSGPAAIFILLFLLLHLYGAQGAYTHNSFGEFLKTHFHLWRNPYDRIVHFSFGFLLIYPCRELIAQAFPAPKNVSLLISNMAILCLATLFELIEWAVAAFTDKNTGDTYVATQGDPWDSQKDIFMAILGALLFTLLLLFKQRRQHRHNPSNTVS